MVLQKIAQMLFFCFMFPDNDDSNTLPIALVVVDIQDAFLKVMPECDIFLRRIQLAVASADLLSIPCLFTEQFPKKLGATHEDVLCLCSDPSVFQKSAFSSYRAEGLSDFIREKDIQHLLICGLETPICIYQTTIDALNDGLEVTLLSDAITQRRKEDAHVAMQEMIRAGAHCLSTESIFYSILADAKHSLFKQFLELVKRAQ